MEVASSGCNLNRSEEEWILIFSRTNFSGNHVHTFFFDICIFNFCITCTNGFQYAVLLWNYNLFLHILGQIYLKHCIFTSSIIILFYFWVNSNRRKKDLKSYYLLLFDN